MRTVSVQQRRRSIVRRHHRLHDRLHGAVITPAIRTPLERSLV
jgi:hypothetical protein